MLRNGDGSTVWEGGDNRTADLAAAAAGEGAVEVAGDFAG